MRCACLPSGLALFLTLGGCSAPSEVDEQEPPARSSSTDRLPQLSQRWPVITSLTQAARGTTPTQTGHGQLRLRALATRVQADLDPADGTLALSVRDLPEPLRLRRLDAASSHAEVEGPSVMMRGESSSALFLPSARGVEELVVIREPSAELSYELDLPPGFVLEHDGAAAITVNTPEGRPVARGLFLSGWDGDGRRFTPAISVQGARIHVELPRASELAYPLLIDPEWIDAAVPIYPRELGGLTLLPDGRVLATGGYTLGEAPSEVYDPDQGVFRTLGEPLSPRQHHSATLLREGTVLLVGGTVPDGDPGTLDVPIATIDRFDPTSGSSEVWATLPEPRSGHTATRLVDGSVLIVGGEKLGVDTPYAGLSDAYRLTEDGTLTELPSLSVARGHHTASRLPDGRVLIAGGRTWAPHPDEVATVHASMELFDPATNSFSVTSEAMAATRERHVAMVFDDGELLLGWGGSAYTLNRSFEHFSYQDSALSNRVLETYLPIGELPFFVSPPATILDHWDLLLASFRLVRYESGFALQEVQEPDQHASSVAPLADGSVLGLGHGLAFLRPRQLDDYKDALVEGQLTEEHGRSALAPLADGRLLIVGGRHIDHDAEVGEEDEIPYVYVRSATLFDPITESVVGSVPLTHARTGHTATRLDDGRVLVAGGANKLSEDTRPTELFDPLTNTFALGPALSLKRSEHTATRLADGRVLFAGGTLEDRHAELFDPATDDIDVSGELELARTDHSAVRLPDGRVAILGGYVATDTPTASVEVFDPASATFSPLGSLRLARAAFAATLLPSGQILVVGGTSFSGVEESIELFDPSSGIAVEAGGKGGGARTGPTATVLPDGSVSVSGGGMLCGATFDTPPHLRLFTLCQDFRRPALLPSGDAGYFSGEFTTKKKKPGSKTEYARRWLRAGRPPAPDAPFITSYPPVAAVGTVVSLTGLRLVSPTEGASGSTRQSATDVPIVEWMPLDGGPGVRGPASQWTATSLTWTVPPTSFHGPGYLWVVTRGKRSPGALVKLVRSSYGMPCAASNDCVTGVCASGVCCDRACDGCEACSAAAKGFGEDGVCEPLVRGASPAASEDCPVEPVSTCGRTGFCDGLGACELQPDDTACLEGASCQEGACVVLQPTCDGDHQIVKGDASLGDCAPYRCSLETHACLTTCSSNLECVSGLVCDDAGACVAPAEPPPPSSSCSVRPRAGASMAWSAWVLVSMGLALRVRRRETRSS